MNAWSKDLAKLRLRACRNTVKDTVSYMCTRAHHWVALGVVDVGEAWRYDSNTVNGL